MRQPCPIMDFQQKILSYQQCLIKLQNLPTRIKFMMRFKLQKLFSMILMLAFFFVMLPPILCQETEQIMIDPCRISREIQSQEFAVCEKIDQCIDDPPPSAVQKCKQYRFLTITDSQCRTLCCPTVPTGSEPLTKQQTTQCIEEWQRKQATLIAAIILGVFGGLGLITTFLALWIFGFTKNPYTGKYVWTGLCCCKRQVDFRGEHEAKQRRIGSDHMIIDEDKV